VGVSREASASKLKSRGTLVMKVNHISECFGEIPIVTVKYNVGSRGFCCREITARKQCPISHMLTENLLAVSPVVNLCQNYVPFLSKKSRTLDERP